MPHRDLLVSPDHAVFVDGKLICARQLVNGTTIRQEKGGASVEYFHVELDSHAILLAEGLPAESYLNTGNRGFFANSGEPLVLHPDLTDETDYPARAAGSCAPFVSDEASVRPVWQRLAERAAALGQPAPDRHTTTDPDLHIAAKGRTVRPLYGENGLYIFALPKGATEVRLVSRAGAPADAWPWLDDRRCLGVNVERIVLRGASELREIPVDHPDLLQGWQAVERDGTALRRWTCGSAVLKLPQPMLDGPTMLEIRAGNGGMAYVTDPERSVRGSADKAGITRRVRQVRTSSPGHRRQDKRRPERNSPPPLAGGGWGEGSHNRKTLRSDKFRARLRAAFPLPQPPPARGGEALFSSRTIILTCMGTSPTMTMRTQRPR